MKVILINGSPRKNWNTHTLLMEAENGAKAAGAETELFHLYDLDFKDCRSCFEYSGLRDTSVRRFGNRHSGKWETLIPGTENHQSGNGNRICDTLE